MVSRLRVLFREAFSSDECLQIIIYRSVENDLEKDGLRKESKKMGVIMGA